MQEIVTSGLYQRLPTVKEQLDMMEPDLKLTGVTKEGVTMGLVNVDLAAKKLQNRPIAQGRKTDWQVEFKEGLERRAELESNTAKK